MVRNNGRRREEELLGGCGGFYPTPGKVVRLIYLRLREASACAKFIPQATVSSTMLIRDRGRCTAHECGFAADIPLCRCRASWFSRTLILQSRIASFI